MAVLAHLHHCERSEAISCREATYGRDCFVAYIESDPGKSNGYARDDYTRETAPPSTDAWAGTDELRAFLDRVLAIFRERYDKGTISAGTTGP